MKLINQIKSVKKWLFLPQNMTYCQRRFLASKTTDNVRVIFDKNTKRIQKSRAAAATDCGVYEYLKEEAAFMLADRVADVKRSFPLALDLGCGRGFLSKNLSTQDGIGCLLQGDICEENIAKAFPSELRTSILVMDEEKPPFRDNSFDLVLSSLSLHWVNDLPGYFNEVLRVLRSDGCFMGVMLGADTLFELRCSLQLAEAEREGGMAPHVSPMIQGHQLANLLYGSGFNLVTLDFDQLIVNYPSIFELMEDLQGMGENSALVHRKMLHRDTLMAAAATYQAMYGDEEKKFIPATFQMLFMIGWKPDQSQQKPLAPGEAPKGFNIKKNES